MTFWNLPRRCHENVPERHQMMVMREDEFVRIIRNSRLEAWQLVRRCRANESYIWPLWGSVPGWFTLCSVKGDRYTPEFFVRWMREHDTWVGSKGHHDRKRTAREYAEDVAGDFDRKSQAASKAALAEASGAAGERFESLYHKRTSAAFLSGVHK